MTTSTTPDLTSDELRDLSVTAQDFLKQHWTREVVGRLEKSEWQPAEAVFERMAGLGWLGLNVPEEYGGAAGGLQSCVAVLEAAGRFVLEEPLLSAILAASALAVSENKQLKARLLPPLALGELQIGVALTAHTMDRSQSEAITAARDGDGWVLRGCERRVPWARRAELLIVPVIGTDAASQHILAVDPSAPKLHVEPGGEEGQAAATVIFDGVSVDRQACIASGDHAAAILQRVTSTAAVCLSALAVGAAEEALTLALSHVNIREQFGQPLSRFQAVQMRCADMAVTLDGMRSITQRAARALDEDSDDATWLASAARAWGIRALLAVTRNAHIVHGAIGFSQEYPLQRYSRWAESTRTLFGDAEFHRHRFAGAYITS